MSEPLRVAVVGVGVGRGHVRAFKALPEQFDLVAICDLDEARGRAVATEYRVPEALTSFDDLCARDDLQVIDICTPPHLHFPQVAQVLAAGKHAICEKPFLGSLRDCDEMVRREAAAGRRVMPIFQYRFGHGLQKLKLLIEAHVTGPAYVATVETAWRRRAEYYHVPWRGRWASELGGAVLGHAIHAHDMLTYALGPVRSVYARVATMVNDIEVEDCAAATLEMADGCLVTLSVTLGSVAEITRHRFTFRDLVAESNTAPYVNSGDPWSFSADTSEIAARLEQTLASFQPAPEGYEGQFARFADALRTGSELPVTIADARASLELVTAIYHSSRTGQPVTLPLDTEHPLYAGWTPD